MHDAPAALSEAVRDDALGFERVYRDYFDRVQRWCAYLTGSRYNSEDLAQKVFEVVLRQLPRFDGRNLSGWIYQITLGIARNERRHQIRYWLRRVELSPEIFEIEGPSTEAAILSRQYVARAMSGLSEDQRLTLLLFEIEDYTAEEIAQLHGVSINTVYSRIRLGRARFIELHRKIMEESR